MRIGLNGNLIAMALANNDFKFKQLADVAIQTAQNKQVLSFNSSTEKFENTDIDTVVADQLSEIDGGTY